MANTKESGPLLPKHGEGDQKGELDGTPAMGTKLVAESEHVCAGADGWTADGLPFVHGSVVGEPVARARWDSSIFACLGLNDEFCSSDLEVCLLGSLAPCVLYGSNAERLGSGPGSFANYCLPYTGLYLLGNSLFGSNCMAPWFSYPSRTAIRESSILRQRRRILAGLNSSFHHVPRSANDVADRLARDGGGSCEAFSRSCGCCGSLIEDEEQLEQCEMACDFATHFFCHPCSLCQEGRELRRRLPHPGFSGRPILLMIPPAEQTMGRGTI